MVRLAQTCIHLRPLPVERRLHDLADLWERVSAQYAQEIFRGEINLEIELVEGSLKGWATVGVMLTTIISAYGELRTGIDYVCRDSRVFSEHVSRAFLEQAEIPGESVFRVERRLRDAGRIQRLFKKLDALEQLESMDTRRAALEEIKDDLRHLLEGLESESDRQAFLAEMPEPIRPPAPTTRLPPSREFAVIPRVPEIEERRHIRRHRRIREGGDEPGPQRGIYLPAAERDPSL